MTEIKLPENLNIYLILVGLIFIIADALIYLSEGWTFVVIFFFTGSLLFMVVGFFGLKKSNDLENKKKEQEIKLLKKQIEEKDAIIGSIEMRGHHPEDLFKR